MILQNTSLCAIVRDEEINPAGGIVDFVRSIVPFVEEAIIVDTGSKDVTREILLDLVEKNPNLKIFDKKWQGYADARNYSLERASQEYILVLDADERLTREDLTKLSAKIKENHQATFFNLGILNILTTGELSTGSLWCGVDPRRLLKLRTGLRYETSLGRYESIGYDKEEEYGNPVETEVMIKHFLPDVGALREKQTGWYESENLNLVSPSEVPSFPKWKALNPQRKNYVFG